MSLNHLNKLKIWTGKLGCVDIEGEKDVELT